MSEFHSSIAVVWPSSLPVSDPEAHCTMLFLGRTDEVSFTKEEVLGVLEDYCFQAPGDCYVKGSAMYGPNGEVHVAELHDPKGVLAEQRGHLEDGLESYGIVSASQYGFSPHVTINHEVLGASTELFPAVVTLGAPVLWWGDERPAR